MRKVLIFAALSSLALVVGCANPAYRSSPSPHAAPVTQPAPPPAPASPPAPSAFASTAVVPLATPLITPDLRPTGRVQMVNTNGHFVVVSFVNNFMPSLQDHLAVFRDGSKIGEIKITGPQREYNIVGEILSGDPQVQDEVKPN